MWTRIRNIWFKELIDSVRDKKGMRQTLLVPIVIGVLYAVLNPLLVNALESRAEETELQQLTVPAVGLANAAGTDLVPFLRALDIVLTPYEGDLRAHVESGEAVVGLVVPEAFAAQVAAEQPAGLQLLTNSSAGDIAVTGATIGRLNTGLVLYDQELVARRLTARGLDPGILTALTVEAESLTTPQQAGSFNARLMLPILVGIVVVSGGLFVALDVTAGEKERGTLEALLVTPASDREIFFGKLLAVFTITILPLILTFVAFGLSSNLLPDSLAGDAVIPTITILGGIAVGIPLALAVNVLLMIVAIRTKTVKDAQSAATPISLGVLVPGLAPAFIPPGNLFAYLIPGYGATAVLGDIAATGTFPVVPFLLSTLSSLLFAALLVPLALRLFDRERLLYSM